MNWLIDDIIIFVGYANILAFIFALLYAFTPCSIGKWLYHDIFGWHKPIKDEEGPVHHCKFCGEEIDKDYQGLWYAKGEYR